MRGQAKPSLTRSLNGPLLVLFITGVLMTVMTSCGSSDALDSEIDSAGQQTTTTAALEIVTSDDPEPEESSDYTEPVTETVEPFEVDVSDTLFSEHIQPIMEKSCASCHGPQEAGSDHFVITNAGDVADYATDIAKYVESKDMPPWPASPLSVAFKDDASLSAEEVARVIAWVEAGAELDVDPATPIVSSRQQSRLEGDERDIVMTAFGGAYAGTGRDADEYRCLIFEPGNTDLEYIVGAHFEADNTQVTHHAIVTLAGSALREQAAELDADDPGPGWSCFGGIGFGGIDGGYTVRMGGWAPGGQPARQPEGYAIPLTAGDFIVVQIHYHYDESTPPDLSRYVLSLASDEQIEANAGWFKRLTGRLYLGPAEIPCYAGDTDPLCDRSAALARVKSLYGNFIGGLPNYFLNSCGAKVEDFAEMTDGTAWSTCDLRVQNPGKIRSVAGHMHELGQGIRLTLNPDTPEERILLDIPDWNFEWQFGYQPVEDIFIDSGDTIRVDCIWNRERAPYEAVGYILWSDGTGDEMCYSSITTFPPE